MSESNGKATGWSAFYSAGRWVVAEAKGTKKS